MTGLVILHFLLQVSIRSSGCDEKESKPKVDGDGGGFALSRAWMFDGYYWVELQDMHEVSLNDLHDNFSKPCNFVGILIEENLRRDHLKPRPFTLFYNLI